MSRKNIALGIIAHVDAGKTTLSESILYHAGAIRNKGRVDHGDAHLDTDNLERQRGITIYSKQAFFQLRDKDFYLLDTPGHVDFTTEMERVLFVLDYCILIISAPESVSPKVKDLWQLLEYYQVPTFIFVNKMDQDGMSKDQIFTEIQTELGSKCIAFPNDVESFTDEQWEDIAVNDERLLENYLEGKTIEKEDIARLIKERKLFPVHFGSALKESGIGVFLNAMERYMVPREYSQEFGARVFKISRDDQNARLTWMKITGGRLETKQSLEYPVFAVDSAEDKDESEQSNLISEKVEQIRVYSGAKYEAIQSAEAGAVVAVTGLKETYIGLGIGKEQERLNATNSPVLKYKIILADGEDAYRAFKLLRAFEDQDPSLNFQYEQRAQEINVNIMGQVQMETLQSRAQEEFNLTIEFSDPDVIYKETIREPVFGIGHFEPLRHYSEVILRLEPLDRGSGIVIENQCSRDTLKANWQSLILSTLKNKRHKGVLTGSDLADVKITLMHGIAHEKHTSSGDFKQASIRAVRQALMQAEPLLLEPMYELNLTIPQNYLGKVMTEIDLLGGTLDAPEIEGDLATVKGSIPARNLGEFTRDLQAYTGDEARVSFKLGAYSEVKNAEAIVEAYNYDPEADLNNPVDSVFCANGAGFIVPWDEVEEFFHSKDKLREFKLAELNDKSFSKTYPTTTVIQNSLKGTSKEAGIDHAERQRRIVKEDNELKQIFERTYGAVDKPKKRIGQRDNKATKTAARNFSDKEKAALANKLNEGRKSYLLVDGYNVLHALPELKKLSETDINAARDKLIDILINYQGFRSEKVILVFDAYKVRGGRESVEDYSGLSVVYTKEAETADKYIERATHEKVKQNAIVRVASSDALEQAIVFGAGALRMSAREFWLHVAAVEDEIREML